MRSPQFRGYTRFGHEHTNGRADLRDQIDIGRELPPPVLGDRDPPWLRLRGPNLWPTALPALRPVMTAWMEALEAVGHRLLHAMSVALGQPADRFDATVDPPEVLLKVIRYRTPPGDEVNAASVSERQGVGAHRDTGFLTFVYQHEVGGLQVRARRRVRRRAGATGRVRGQHRRDVPARHPGLLPGHRAPGRRARRPGTDRVSLAYFFNPKLEATLAPIELPPELAAEAPGGESVDPANPILANYGDNSLKVRLRSHPDVAELHHADLLASGAWTTTS